MTVSERERRYLRRLGELKAASHEVARAEHRAHALGERLQRSWRLFEDHRGAGDVRDRDDDPSRFYDRARALGLYQP